MRKRTRTGTEPYAPYIPKRVDQKKLVEDISTFFGLPLDDVKAMYRDYRQFHKQHRYKQRLSEKKTLCFEEAFIAYVIMSMSRPESLVEIGTQYGNSTRRLVDMKQKLGLGGKVVCFDVEDQLKWCTKDEVELVLKDVTGSSKEDVFEAQKPDFIYLDAHPYYLLMDVIARFLEYDSPCMMAIHDCGWGLCNRHMTVPKEDPHVDSGNGVWERHALAEIFGVDDPAGEQLDELETDTHRLKIFDTPHGLAVIAPKL